jgi:hypothetical protein
LKFSSAVFFEPFRLAADDDEEGFTQTTGTMSAAKNEMSERHMSMI